MYVLHLYGHEHREIMYIISFYTILDINRFKATHQSPLSARSCMYSGHKKKMGWLPTGGGPRCI